MASQAFRLHLFPPRFSLPFFQSDSVLIRDEFPDADPEKAINPASPANPFREAIRNQISRLVRHLPFSRRVGMVATVVPRALWWHTAIVLSRLQARLPQRDGHTDLLLREGLMRDHWLAEFSKRGAFHVPYRVIGAEHLQPSRTTTQGTIYCGIHIPLFPVSARCWNDLGVSPDFVVSSPGNINASGKYLPTGCPDGIKAMPPGVGALLHARAVLRAGGTVGSMLDARIGDTLCPQLMRLAVRTGAQVVLFWSELSPDGVVLLTHVMAPHSPADTEEKLQENLAVLAEERTRIYRNLSRPQSPIEDREKTGETASSGCLESWTIATSPPQPS
jgi:hypothetical protein